MFAQFRGSFVAISLGFVCLIASPGCGSLLRTLLESDEELPVKNEAGLEALGRQFVDALEKKDYTAAYALCSSQLKARQTEEAFVADLKSQWELHAKNNKPQETETTLYMPYKDELDEWDGFPKDIDYAKLQGQVTLEIATKLEDDEVMEGFEIDLFVVEDGGQPRIAYLEFYNYDE